MLPLCCHYFMFQTQRYYSIPLSLTRDNHDTFQHWKDTQEISSPTLPTFPSPHDPSSSPTQNQHPFLHGRTHYRRTLLGWGESLTLSPLPTYQHWDLLGQFLHTSQVHTHSYTSTEVSPDTENNIKTN